MKDLKQKNIDFAADTVAKIIFYHNNDFSKKEKLKTALKMFANMILSPENTEQGGIIKEANTVPQDKFTISDFFTQISSLLKDANLWWHRDTSSEKNNELLKKYYPEGYYCIGDEMILNMYRLEVLNKKTTE